MDKRGLPYIVWMHVIKITVVYFRFKLINTLLHKTMIQRNVEVIDNTTNTTSSSFLVHLSRRLKCTIVITCCPSSVVNFSHFDFSSETTEQNSTKLHRKQELNILYQVCVFRVHRKNKMAALASDPLRHFRLLLWNRWTEFNETWQEARSQRPLPSLCFSADQ